jgi:hypothetical protein
MDLRYATNASGTWSLWIIDSDGDVGADSAIAIDSQDNVHICYYDYTNETLRYASNSGGSWSITIIDSEVYVGYHSAIAIDSQDNVHISYFDAMNMDLRYANSSGGSWSKWIIDSEGELGYDSAIAIDSQDNVHISYSDDSNGYLCYATNYGGSWSLWVIEEETEVGSHSSIAVDSMDRVHITYYDYTNGTLCYAISSGSYWVIDSEGDVGADSAIAIGPHDDVHISYYDYTNGDLKYATFSSNVVETPGPPTGVVVTPADGQLLINWTAPVDDGGAAINYYLVYHDGVLVKTEMGTTVNITGLTNGVIYDLAIAAHNSMGEGPASDTVSAAPSNAISAPMAPEGLNVTPGNDQVQLSWNAPLYDGGSSIIGYTLYWSVDPNEGFTGIPVEGTTFLHQGLDDGSTFYYYVTAVNQIGEGAPSMVLDATLVDQALVPSAPSNLTIGVDGDTIELSWDEPLDDGGSPIIEYTIYRGTDPSNLTEIGTVTNTSFVDKGTDAEVEYQYQVIATNDNGIGQPSNVVTATVTGGGISIDLPMEYLAAAGVGGVAVVGAAALLLRKRKRRRS